MRERSVAPVNPLATLKRHGLQQTAAFYRRELAYRWSSLRTRKVARFQHPGGQDLVAIEGMLAASGVGVTPLRADKSKYEEFSAALPFPEDYHGGTSSGYWHEKIFEHYLSWELLDMDRFQAEDRYLDVAAGSSPWARLLREHRGLTAFAIDLKVHPELQAHDYYIEGDATASPFASASLRGISLHCAYEMFAGDSDSRAVGEFARILAPGGAVVIAPLYMHTHYCCFSSPECWGRGHADPGAVEYVCPAMRNLPAVRHYDAARLRERVLEPARRSGLEPQLLRLHGTAAISPEIYCHFVLMLRKP